GPGAGRRLPGAWLDRRAAHHAGRDFRLHAAQRPVAPEEMAGLGRRDLRGPDAAVVDTRPQPGRILDAQLGAMEYQRLWLAALSGSPEHPARPALVPVADLAFRLAGGMALALMADGAAHVDTADVRGVAAGRHA